MRLSKYEGKKDIVVTIVIPVFNQSHTINRCMDSILSAGNGLKKEIFLINDGSTDDSEEICLKYEKEYEGVKYFYQENKGVSAARNLGIKHATGKYIFYLDADDELEPLTVERVTAFFETVQEEVDMVTYKIDTIYDGRLLAPHFRYRYLTESKVYDLRTMPYIGQTTMNIVVKNRFEDNILFDETQSFSEDQRYCCDVLHDKLKIGYCTEGRYIYYRSETSSSGRLAGACYIFEQCTQFFEDLFAKYEKEVPMAFQGLYVNDLAWKLCTNILLPYHYEREQYDAAISRLKKLLNRCDNSVIAMHPQIDGYEKFYLLRLKENSNVKCLADNTAYRLVADRKCYINESKMEIVLTKVSVMEGTIVRIEGFLKTVFFQFYDEIPTFCAVENDGRLTRKITLRKSAHNYYLSHEETQNFYTFKYECDVTEVHKVGFKVEVMERWYPVKYYFMPLIPFSYKYKKYKYERENVFMKINKKNEFIFTMIKPKEKKKVWLYYDCAGVISDNGMKQFLHDYKINDNIKRYYVVTDGRQRVILPKEINAVEFGSRQHRKLFLQTDKIITAYIEESNIIPYPREEYEKYADRFKFEVIYLQHGVLHINMPWKYSPERIMADRIVVSTIQEAELYIRNGFAESSLIKTRMPRFARKLDKKKTKKILFAPSWRSYLVGQYKNRVWQRQDSKFLSSQYFKNIKEFLTSDKLESILKKYDYTLEVKLHPIFSIYRKYFDIQSDSIHIVEKTDDAIEYDVFITDFSSYMYDFLFQDIPVILYLPDEMEFKAGMNGYRSFGDNEQYWAKVCLEYEEVLKYIEKNIINDKVDKISVSFYDVEEPCTAIYDAII